MHWNNRTPLPLFLYFEKNRISDTCKNFLPWSEGPARRAMKLCVSIRKSETWVGTHFCGPNMGVPACECLMVLTRPERSQAGVSSFGPSQVCTLHSITQGHCVLFGAHDAWGTASLGRFESLPAESLRTQESPLLLCFFTQSVSILGT